MKASHGIMTRVAVALSTVFGAGYFPLAPGSFASALTVLACASLGPVVGHVARAPLLLAAAAVLYVPACWAAGVAERVFAQPDPGRVVLDEVVGQMITLAAVPQLPRWEGWKYWLAGFILFRFFDIAKPFPARRSERLPGGIGIVTDDVVAGIYGFLVLKLALVLGI